MHGFRDCIQVRRDGVKLAVRDRARTLLTFDHVSSPELRSLRWFRRRDGGIKGIEVRARIYWWRRRQEDILKRHARQLHMLERRENKVGITFRLVNNVNRKQGKSAVMVLPVRVGVGC